MERLQTTKFNWWTRRVGDWTMLCVEVYHPSPLITTKQVWETVIGRSPRMTEILQ